VFVQGEDAAASQVLTETFTLSLLMAVLLKWVLEAVDLVFGDSVSLGGFLSVTLLILVLLLSRAAVQRLLHSRRLRE
jgi:hypothetical protein